jgi:hypothetical protein
MENAPAACNPDLITHRDRMFENDPDGKPISVIITTLAARAYGGETDVYSALRPFFPG